MSNLPAVSSIAGPSISGTVAVPLAELDKMRSDHANAIKLAKGLEEKQKQVKITTQWQEHVVKEETTQEYVHGTPGTRNTLGTPGHFKDVVKFVNDTIIQEQVAFINLEDIMGSLEAKVSQTVQAQIDSTLVMRDVAEQKLVNIKVEISDLKKSHLKRINKMVENAKLRDEEIFELKEVSRLDQEIIETQGEEIDEDDTYIEQLETQIRQYEELLSKRTLAQRFFSW